MTENKWKTAEVRRLISVEGPFMLYRLPSGFRNTEIEVCEDPFGELSVRHVEKGERQKADSRPTSGNSLNILHGLLSTAISRLEKIVVPEESGGKWGYKIEKEQVLKILDEAKTVIEGLRES